MRPVWREGLLGKIDDDFNIVGLLLERQRPLLGRHTPRDQLGEPVFIGALQHADGVLVMLAIGVDAAKHGVVAEHHGAIEIADVELQIVAGRRDPDQADDAARRRAAERVADHARGRRCTPSGYRV